jgi:hypothetical protein
MPGIFFKRLPREIFVHIAQYGAFQSIEIGFIEKLSILILFVTKRTNISQQQFLA